MNVIEIKDLTKNFGQKQALKGLNMTVPKGAIYGFIGENGSGKSTTEKLICGLILPSDGQIKIFGKDYMNAEVKAKMGVLIELPGCFPGLTVWDNMKLQAANLGIKNANQEIVKILKMVRMEGAASNKYRNCSLGMKQRIGIAMALLGNPELLVLDEPINALDADGMRIMREVLCDLARNGVTIVISSHILGELEKIATHYGIIRGGKMLCEMTAAEQEANCPSYVALQTNNLAKAKAQLSFRYSRVEADAEQSCLRVYDAESPEEIVSYLYEHGILVSEIKTAKISLEEYYIDLMKEGR